MNKLKKWRKVFFAVSFVAMATAFSLAVLPDYFTKIDGQTDFTVERNTDRAGGDYNDFDLAQPKYQSCQNACADDGNCQAYTYGNPGLYGRSKAHCWLKNTVPQASSSSCCISGVKKGCGKGEFAGDWYAGEWSNITFNQNCNQVNGTYTRGNGTIYGTASGNRLDATWQQEGRTGTVYFIILSNGNLEGKYCEGRNCDPGNGTSFSGRRR